MSRKTRGKASQKIVIEARQHRKKPTLTEQKLWEALRSRRLAGLKFRRQHPYDRYILDFFCVSHQLAVEIDGGIHQHPEQKKHDEERTAYLQSQGITVLRFKNEDVVENLERVLEEIVNSTSPTPHPPPSPEAKHSGEGGGAEGGGG